MGPLPAPLAAVMRLESPTTDTDAAGAGILGGSCYMEDETKKMRGRTLSLAVGLGMAAARCRLAH